VNWSIPASRANNRARRRAHAVDMLVEKLGNGANFASRLEEGALPSDVLGGGRRPFEVLRVRRAYPERMGAGTGLHLVGIVQDVSCGDIRSMWDRRISGMPRWTF